MKWKIGEIMSLSAMMLNEASQSINECLLKICLLHDVKLKTSVVNVSNKSLLLNALYLLSIYSDEIEDAIKPSSISGENDKLLRYLKDIERNETVRILSEIMFKKIAEFVGDRELSDKKIDVVSKKIAEEIGGTYPEIVTNDFLDQALQNLVKQLKKIERLSQIDNKTLEAPPEGPVDGVFGQYLFGTHREDVPYENDTDIEEMTYQELRDYIRDNSQIGKNVTSTLQDVLSTNQYNKLITPPNENYIYRGMSVSDAWIRKALDITSDDKLSFEGTSDKSFNFTLIKGNVASWSESEDQAKHFSNLNLTAKHLGKLL